MTEMRGSDGRFQPGHQPPKSPGRPLGPNGLKARAALLASERLEQMLERAAAVIKAELQAGNPQVATWLVDRVRPPGRSDYVHLSNHRSFEDIPDIVAASKDTALAVARGEMSLQDAKAFQEILIRHGQIIGYQELAKLRQDIDALQKSTNQRGVVDRSHFPAWGGLREGSN